MLHNLACESRKNLVLHQNRSTFCQDGKKCSSKAERELIKLLSEKLKNVVDSVETELKSLLHTNFLADSMVETKID